MIPDWLSTDDTGVPLKFPNSKEYPLISSTEVLDNLPIRATVNGLSSLSIRAGRNPNFKDVVSFIVWGKTLHTVMQRVMIQTAPMCSADTSGTAIVSCCTIVPWFVQQEAFISLIIGTGMNIYTVNPAHFDFLDKTFMSIILRCNLSSQGSPEQGRHIIKSHREQDNRQKLTIVASASLKRLILTELKAENVLVHQEGSTAL